MTHQFHGFLTRALSTTGTQTIRHEIDSSVDVSRQNGHIMDGADVTDDDTTEDEDEPDYPWQKPKSILATIWWLLFLPINILFFITIPDVRRAKCVTFFPITFLMSVAWIGAISYELTWLITVIGYTIRVPDTVMGLSFLAVGTSIPEVFSSLIVSKQGKGK